LVRLGPISARSPRPIGLIDLVGSALQVLAGNGQVSARDVHLNVCHIAFDCRRDFAAGD
jgi:hypothetical protein